MTENLAIALQITLIGMGLVFLGIILLWLFMIGLTKFTSPKQLENENEQTDASEASELKKKAAAVAVAVLLAKKKEERISHFPLPPTAIVSAWQLTMRTRQLDREARPK
jgi:Na+-transporting methylmalonyl-CoA/oxaloacetate decarboxylase gamma subunit